MTATTTPSATLSNVAYWNGPDARPDASKTLTAIWGRLTDAQRDALLPHLNGNTSARWLADVLTAEGFRIGKTSINRYRAALRAESEQR